MIFNHSHDYNGSTLLLGALFFTFRSTVIFGILRYCVGYSQVMGIELLRNFAFPYFSHDIAEFWRRWHILSTWFRDYLYIPLGGSRGSTWVRVKYVHHFSGERVLAWRQLDIYCLGHFACALFLPLLLTNRNRNNLEIIAQGKMRPVFASSYQWRWPFWLWFLPGYSFAPITSAMRFNTSREYFPGHFLRAATAWSDQGSDHHLAGSGVCSHWMDGPRAPVCDISPGTQVEEALPVCFLLCHCAGYFLVYRKRTAIHLFPVLSDEKIYQTGFVVLFCHWSSCWRPVYVLKYSGENYTDIDEGDRPWRQIPW